MVTLDKAATRETTAPWFVGFVNTSPPFSRRFADRNDIPVASHQGTVTFAVGESSKTISVPTVDDSIDEATERFFLVVRRPTPRGSSIFPGRTDMQLGYGYIHNDDPIPGAWLARFGRTVSEQALDGITDRMTAPRVVGFESNLMDRIQNVGSQEDVFGPAPDLTMRDLLVGSRFSLTGEEALGTSAGFWGRVAQTRFDGEETGDGTDISLDGAVTTGMLGADYTTDRWMAGLALMQSDGEGSYRPVSTEDGTSSRVESRLTAAIPYAALHLDRLHLWGAAGIGTGEVTVREGENDPLGSDIGYSMGAVGVRGDLVEAPEHDSGAALALTSDALWTRTSSDATHELAGSKSDTTRLRLGLEGGYCMVLEGDASLTPKLALGARHDGGDAETGFGVEIGGGIAWIAPRLGLALHIEGRTLIAHEADGLKDRGYSASLVYDPAPSSGRGLSMNLRQEVGGRANGGVDALFAPDPLEDRAGSDALAWWSMEEAYGFPAFGGRFTGSPYAGLDLATGARDYSLGWRLAPEGSTAPDLAFGVKATRRESDAAGPEHTVGLELRTRW